MWVVVIGMQSRNLDELHLVCDKWKTSERECEKQRVEKDKFRECLYTVSLNLSFSTIKRGG